MVNKFKKIIIAVKDQSKVRGSTHRFYTYPAGFSPVFVEAAIQSLSKKNDLILDPFMGGGTTLIEALRAERKVVGIDLNPIATFVTKVKSNKISKKNHDNIEKWAAKMSKNINFKLKDNRFIKKAFSVINYKGLGKKEISNLKKIIKGSAFYLKHLKKIKNKIGALEDGDLLPENVEEIARQLDVPEDDVVAMNRRMIGGDVSLNAKINSDGETEEEWQSLLVDQSEDHTEKFAHSDEARERRAILIKSLIVLNEREKSVILDRRMKEPPLTLEQLSEKHGISRERVRQIENKAIDKLKAKILELT